VPLTILRAALDTLEVSYTGTLAPGSAERLDAYKAQAQAQNTPASLTAGVYELFMRDKAFGHWRWLLTHPEFHLRLLPNARPGQPSAQIRLSAFGLANQSPELLLRFAVQALSEFGSFEELVVSRADVAVDFQGFEPTVALMQNVVCPASFRPIYPSIDNAQTFQFGKGAVVVRVYNKTAEIDESGKRWHEESWQITGRYDPSLPVWRGEAQFRRSALKELSLHSSADVFSNMGALLDYGLAWANLRVPTADATKTRWPEDPRWTVLRSAVFDGQPLLRPPTLATLLSLDATASRMLTNVATLAARYDIDDFEQAMERAWWVLFHELRSKDLDFSALVERRRRRILDTI
jgi:hypothetical protein